MGATADDTDDGLTTCAVCGTELRRRLYRREREAGGPPDVYTRTLVAGEMRPSCSRECAAVLRMQIG